MADKIEEIMKIRGFVDSLITSYESVNELLNFDKNLILDDFSINLKKSFFERKAIKIAVIIHAVISITIPLKLKYQIPKIEIIIIPTAL